MSHGISAPSHLQFARVSTAECISGSISGGGGKDTRQEVGNKASGRARCRWVTLGSAGGCGKSWCEKMGRVGGGARGGLPEMVIIIPTAGLVRTQYVIYTMCKSYVMAILRTSHVLAHLILIKTLGGSDH